MRRTRDLKIELDAERVQEIWREAVDLEPVNSHWAIAAPPDIRHDPPPAAEEVTNPASLRVITVPNIISLIRVLLVPVFVWQLVGPHNYGVAFGLIVFIGLSDWADGKIARIWHVESKIGAYLDPAADRLLTVCVPISMAIVNFIPWWIVALILVRDAVLTLLLPIYQRRGLRMSVIYLGKVATASLMSAFPLILIAHLDVSWNTWVMPFAWAVLIWALGLYTWTGILYVRRVMLIRRRVPVMNEEQRRQWEHDRRILQPASKSSHRSSSSSQ